MDVIKGNENSTLTVKIPRVHLSPSAREEITARRAVWGTDVYTDDSDVVAACIHAGWIRGEWGDDVDVDLLDLYKPATTKKQRAAAAEQPLEVLTSPPASGPVQIPADRDLHVTLLVLPALDKYSSSTRYGIQSREFGGTYNGRKSIHDGISFMILNVRWVDGAAPQSRLRGKARRERIRKAMTEMNRSQVVDIGEKELLSKTTTRDAGIDKEKNHGKSVGSNIGEGNKENRPAVSVLNDATSPSKQEKPYLDTKMDLDAEVKEKSSPADSQSADTTTIATSAGKEPADHGSNESTDVST
ncbi:histone deacetylation protein Rxt3-domain-containing protein [Rostrohypoxylon terebratum]|nr:histone deacetylation protein Rxt3-domain-containing protein [Rostrohypoxylon terebratum]